MPLTGSGAPRGASRRRQDSGSRIGWPRPGAARGIDSWIAEESRRAQAALVRKKRVLHPVVGAMRVEAEDGRAWVFCTLTAVTPTVVITAGHCNARAEENGDQPIQAVFLPGDGGEPIRRHVDVSGLLTHPDFVPGLDPPSLDDIGLARLLEPLDFAVYPRLRAEPLAPADLGATLLVIGFGATSTGGSDMGVKRSLEMTITEMPADAPEQFVVSVPGEEWRGTCNGDSGGAGLALGGARDVQVGVHARAHELAGEEWLCGEGEQTSVPHFYESFILPGVLALDPTAADCGDWICTGIESAEGCPEDFEPSECGNGAVEGREACDDGNRAGGDGCSADCLSDESCGNGVVDSDVGEQCDDGNGVGGDGCSSDCGSDETCGNGVIDTAVGEACDDGNRADDDGCSADCSEVEGCGDGVVDVAVGELCDDGNTTDGDGCSATCRSDESCGNGVVDVAVGETCDDGNTTDGDDCPPACGVPDEPPSGCGCRAAAPQPSVARSWVRILAR